MTCSGPAAMTFEDFQATREDCGDLGKRMQDASFESGEGGYVYLDGGRWIQRLADGSYYLLIGRADWIDSNLEPLEQRLWEWAISEGLISRPGQDNAACTDDAPTAQGALVAGSSQGLTAGREELQRICASFGCEVSAEIFRAVWHAMQAAEERGGPEAEQYIPLMEAIARVAKQRAAVARNAHRSGE